MSNFDIISLSLATVRQKLQSHELSALEVTQACCAQIAATEPSIHALLARCEDTALAQAKALDASGPKPDKPLWGVPVTVKDGLCTKGLTTTAASKILKDFVPFYDAFVVSRLREAGAVILGKNNMDEFAMGSSTENSAFGPTRNPHNIDRVPGGSSGGSAASVTAGQCFASLGSDTGGSIRQPAALCGCVGVKPSYGRVSRYGLIAFGSSLDQVGPLARSVRDCAIMLDVITGHDPQDSTSDTRPLPVGGFAGALTRTDLHGVRIGVPEEFFAEGLSAEVEAVCRNAIKEAQTLGARIVPITLPHTKAAVAAYYIIAMAEASANLARFDGVRYGHSATSPRDLMDLYVRSRSEGFGEEVQRRIMLGTYVLSSGYYDAYFRKAAQARRLIHQDFTKAFEQCDIILGPTTPVTAWEIGQHNTDPLQIYLMDIYTLSLNMAGLPGLSLPGGMGQGSQLPVGVQLMGRAFDEAYLLSVAHVLEGHSRAIEIASGVTHL